MLPLPLPDILRRAEEEDEEHEDEPVRLRAGVIAGIVVGVVVFATVLFVLCWYNRHRFRRRKIKRRNSEDEEKPLSVNRAIAPSASPDESPTEMPMGRPERQTTEPMSPAPAYSSIQDVHSSSYDAHSAERGSELDGLTGAINGIGSLGKRAEHGQPEKGSHGLELDSLDSRSAQRPAHELAIDNTQSSDPTKRYSELDSRRDGSAELRRLQYDAIEMPDSSVSGPTMMDTNVSGGIVSPMTTGR